MMKKRVSVFLLICFTCTVSVLLAGVIGVRDGNIHTFYPEPDFSSYAKDIEYSYDSTDTTTTRTGQPESTAAAVTVNINTATAQELAETLPGIGEVKAQSIVEYRETIGGFNSVDELLEVRGIGETTLNMIRPYCVV